MQTCRRQEGNEVCAWLEHFELRRFYSKQRKQELYKGVYLIEGRSIRTIDGHSASLTFEWSGPEAMLTDDVVTTHSDIFRDLKTELESYGIGEISRMGFAATPENFGVFLELLPDENLGLVGAATCSSPDTGAVSGRIFVENYPSLDAMLQCLSKN